ASERAGRLGISKAGLDLPPGRYQARVCNDTHSCRADPVSERESMPVDVVIVGAGPAGLAAAIRLKHSTAALAVAVPEKGSQVGAHILSGAGIDPLALAELVPDGGDTCPLADVPVTSTEHCFLTRRCKWAMPHVLLPPLM